MSISEQILIEGNLVTRQQVTVMESVALDSFLSRLERRVPIVSPVLPTGTRAQVWDETDLNERQLLIMVEVEPQVINFAFDANRDGDPNTDERYRLPIPYSRFIFHCTTSNPDDNRAWAIANYRIFWAKTKYADPAALDMIPALLPNVYPDGRICFGSTGANAAQSLAQRLDQTVNEFYISRFNSDLSIRFPVIFDQNEYSERWNAWAASRASSWGSWTDWAPGMYTTFSWNNMITQFLAHTATRDEFMAIPDGIPDVPLGASFGRIAEVLADWADTDIERMNVATTRALEARRG